jgi:hypothetical protein
MTIDWPVVHLWDLTFDYPTAPAIVHSVRDTVWGVYIDKYKRLFH